MGGFLEKSTKKLLLGYFIYSLYVFACYTVLPSFVRLLIGKRIMLRTWKESFPFVKAVLFLVVICWIYVETKKKKQLNQ